MKIGLVRHFKVDAPFSYKSLNSFEFAKSQLIYHQSPVIKHPVDLEQIKWQKCYCSTLPRAQKTANYIFDGKTVYSDKLVEVEVSPAFETKAKLPFTVWVVLARLGWIFGHHSQIESKKDTLRRCEDVYDLLAADSADNILVVSHGFFLHEFAKFLKKKDFTGKIDFAPQNAKLYVFEK